MDLTITAADGEALDAILNPGPSIVGKSVGDAPLQYPRTAAVLSLVRLIRESEPPAPAAARPVLGSPVLAAKLASAVTDLQTQLGQGTLLVVPDDEATVSDGASTGAPLALSLRLESRGSDGR